MIYQVSYKTYLYGVYRTINTFILASSLKALDLELGKRGIVFYEVKERKNETIYKEKRLLEHTK